MPIRIVTVSGASGAGKSSYVREMLARRPEWKLVPSLTTRASREKDLPGEYRHVSAEEFAALEAAGEFLWTSDAFGHRYGTLKRSLNDLIGMGPPSFLLINPSKVRPLNEYFSVFQLGIPILNLYARSPPEDVLRGRLERRKDRDGLDEAEIRRRVAECAAWDAEAKASGLPYRFIPWDVSVIGGALRALAEVEGHGRFAEVFRLNVSRRSRTAKGKDEGSKTSSQKKPLLLQGDSLKAKVAENAERLIADVLDVRGSTMIAPGPLRAACERWFDIANDGLYGPDAYRTEFGALVADAERLSRATGESYPLNPRYRFWTPDYTTIKVPPLLLERHMDAFYDELTKRLARAKHHDEWEAARLMAYADIMVDGELHPWMDGCGRLSTALVMAIVRELGVDPPLFAETKEGHYATIKDIDLHASYFARCLERSRVL